MRVLLFPGPLIHCHTLVSQCVCCCPLLGHVPSHPCASLAISGLLCWKRVVSCLQGRPFLVRFLPSASICLSQKLPLQLVFPAFRAVLLLARFLVLFSRVVLCSPGVRPRSPVLHFNVFGPICSAGARIGSLITSPASAGSLQPFSTSKSTSHSLVRASRSRFCCEDRPAILSLLLLFGRLKRRWPHFWLSCWVRYWVRLFAAFS